jgi:hypothetical protein
MMENPEGPLEAIRRAVQDDVPGLRPDLVPPLIRGTAALAHRAFVDHGLDDLLRSSTARPMARNAGPR